MINRVTVYVNNLLFFVVILNDVSGGYSFSWCESLNKSNHAVNDNKIRKVKIDIYYESMCPFSRQTFSENVEPIASKLGPYLNITTNPYGDATTSIQGEMYSFVCQHGPLECYGNKLHACALEQLGNVAGLLYNACLMAQARERYGSDDKAADECGAILDVNSTLIKKCAKELRGAQLLAAYGVNSDQIDFPYVPYILINGVVSETNGQDLIQEVCDAFKPVKPQPCRELELGNIATRRKNLVHRWKPLVCMRKSTKETDLRRSS